jgi:hypothetical protein
MTTFVGKSQRQHRAKVHTWQVKVDGWWLTITRQADLLPFEWGLSSAARPMTVLKGAASSVHEAEEDAAKALANRGPKTIGRCTICLGPAIHTKIVRHRPTVDAYRVVYVCASHTTICRQHGLDPCPECDGR